MRSLLFVPGNSAKMQAKASSCGADVVIFDLEDAVHPDSKTEARALTGKTLREASRAGPQIYVRVNSLDSAWCQADIEAIVPARPDGIMLPKLTGPHDLDRLDALMARHEPADAKGATRIIAVCTETPGKSVV